MQRLKDLRLMAVVFLFVFSLSTAAGCETTGKKAKLPEFQQDAATVTVSVMPPIPFAEVADQLSPRIDLTFEKALEEAVQTSTSSNTLVRDMFSAALQAGMTDAKGGIAGVEERAAIPEIGGGDAAAGTGNASGVPAIIKYSSAVALYQEIKLLENYVKQALKMKGYTAYVLRVPVTVFPVKRDLPLDVYSTLSFFVTNVSGADGSGGNSGAQATQPGKTGKISLDVPLDKSRPDGGLPEMMSKSGGAFMAPGAVRIEGVDLSPISPEEVAKLGGGGGQSDAGQSSVPLAIERRTVDFGSDAATKALETGGADGLVTLPLVLPLMVSEHLEKEGYDSRSQMLREYGLSLLLMFENLGLGGGFKKAREAFEHFAGNDYNTLQSLGRLSDNTILARFGAVRNPAVADGGYEMLARTHTASFLLLLPPKTKLDKDTRVELLARTDLCETEDGSPLKSKPGHDIKEGLTSLLDSHYRDVKRTEDIPDERLKQMYSDYNNVIMAVVNNDAIGFRESFNELLKGGIEEQKSADKADKADKKDRVTWNFEQYYKNTAKGLTLAESDFGILWQRTLEIVKKMKTAKVSFALPVPPKPFLPKPSDTQALMIVNEKQLSAKLFGCRNLTGTTVSASLRLKVGNGKLLLGAEKTSVFGGGTGIEATFLSPEALKMEVAAIKQSKLLLTVGEDDATPVEYGCYAIDAKEQAEDPAKAFSLTISDQVPIAAGGIAGQLRIEVANIDKVKGKGELVVRVEGANDVGVGVVSGTDVKLGVQNPEGWRTVTGNGWVLLDVSGLSSGPVFKLHYGFRDKKGKVAEAKPLGFTARSTGS